MMRTDSDIAVILLDVVMEDPHAGLAACRAIREELGNRFVRTPAYRAARRRARARDLSNLTSIGIDPRPS